MGFIDIDTYLISDIIVLPGIVILLGGGLLIFLAMVGKLLFKKEAMGGGDIKLLAMIGAFLGWKCVFISIFFASLLGTIISFILIGLKKKKIDDYVPFGPYLGLGAVVSVVYKGMTFLGFFFH